MKTQESILETAGETFEYANLFVQQQIRYAKLDVAERVAKSISSVATYAALALIGGIFTLMLSIAIGLLLGQVIGSYGLAFLVVTILYGLLALAIYYFRRPLVTSPVLTMIIESFFD